MWLRHSRSTAALNCWSEFVNITPPSLPGPPGPPGPWSLVSGLWSAVRQFGFMLLIVLKATRSADRSNRNLFLCKDKLTSCKQTEMGAAERRCDAASERGLCPAQRHQQTQCSVVALWCSWTPSVHVYSKTYRYKVNFLCNIITKLSEN